MGRNTFSCRDRDKIISIQRRTVTGQDSRFGTGIIAWVTIADKIHANLEDILPSRKDRSEVQSDEIRIASRPTRVRIAFRTDITSDMRVIVHTPVYRLCKIVTMSAELGRKDGLEFMIDEFTTQGDGP